MIFDHAFLRTRVARRILLLFLICCLLPIATIGVVGYFQVSRELHRQSAERLQINVKIHSMAVLERLGFLDANLRMLASSLPSQGAQSISQEASDQFHESFTGVFRSIVLVREEQPPVPLIGDVPQLAELLPDAALALAGGLTVGATTPGDPGHPSQIFLVTPLDPENPAEATLWGEADQAYLWGVREQASTLPEAMQICILDAANRPLFCPGSNISAAQVFIDASQGEVPPGPFTWRDAGQREYKGAHWPLFLLPTLHIPNWTVILSQPDADIMSGILKFRRTFPLFVLLSLWVALFLSNVQVRRSLDPLIELRAGTRRIAARDFDSRVQITSGDEFEDLAKSFNGMAMRLGRQFNALTAINEIDRAILSALETDAIIDTVFARIGEVVPSDGLNVTLLDLENPWTATSHIGSRRVASAKVVKEIELPELEIRELGENSEFLRLEDGGARRSYLDFPAFEPGELTSFLVLPIIVSDELSGIISLGFRKDPDYSEDDHAHARQLADQMGVALSNARLIDELDRLNWGTLIALARAIDAKSPWTAGHSERVTALACEIGRTLGLSTKEIDTLTRGGLLHDVGKIGTPVTVLDKPGRLTPEELKTMRDHVTIGAQILEPVKPLAEAIPILLQHHERYDGQGYPLGLAGDEIHRLAQILSVADAFDAMQSNRPYRKGKEWEEAIEEVRSEAGKSLNPDVVHAFMELIDREEIRDIFRTTGHAMEHLAIGVQRAAGGFRMPSSSSASD